MWWHTVTHWRGSEGETGKCSGLPVPFTLPRNMVYPILLPLLPLMCTSQLPVVDWTDTPGRFKWTRPFCWKTKSGFCACAITFETCSADICLSTVGFTAISWICSSLELIPRLWIIFDMQYITHFDRRIANHNLNSHSTRRIQQNKWL